MLVRMPCRCETDTFRTLAGSRILARLSRLAVGFFCQVQNSAWQCQVPSTALAKCPNTPQEGPAPWMSGSFLCHMCLRIQPWPSLLRLPSQHKTSRAVVCNLPSRNSFETTGLLHITLTSQEMTVTLQHSWS